VRTAVELGVVEGENICIGRVPVMKTHTLPLGTGFVT